MTCEWMCVCRCGYVNVHCNSTIVLVRSVCEADYPVASPLSELSTLMGTHHTGYDQTSVQNSGQPAQLKCV